MSPSSKWPKQASAARHDNGTFYQLRVADPALAREAKSWAFCFHQRFAFRQPLNFVLNVGFKAK